MQLTGHSQSIPCPHRFAHSFVENRSNDSAVKVPGMARIVLRHLGNADHRLVIGQHKLQMQPRGIGGAASKAAIRSLVSKWRKVLSGIVGR